MAFSYSRLLHRCRRRNATAAALASVSFLVLVLVFAIYLTHDDAAGTFVAPGGASSSFLRSSLLLRPEEEQEGTSCQEALRSLPDHGARCRYLSSSSSSSHPPPCAPQGYVDYLRLFYCAFGRAPWLGGAALALWLLVLFYLLGDTASEYFCESLEGLSAALRLPPSVAGVTLLSLGNGAPDVLSSVVAFASSGGGEDAGDVGLSSVLGGALFVSTVVAGVVAIVAGRGDAPAIIERRGFVRDVCFLLVALCYLLAVLLTGTVTVWAAASFLSLYAAYVLLVWTSHCCENNAVDALEDDDDEKQQQQQLVEEEDCISTTKPAAAAYDDLAVPLLLDLELPVQCGSNDKPQKKTVSRRVLDALHAPLYLPRRLTIPDIAAHRWSKPYAVISAFLSPLLLLAATTTSFSSSPAILTAGLIAGAALSAAAAHSTTRSAPPASPRLRLPWLAGGFLMSVLWSYLLARELVALLVAAGLVAGVKASVLGATVLAWGNSLGDLVADVAMAAHDGGAQTAVAGCYAGPAFNTVVGLGLSLTMAAAARYPDPYVIPVDASAYQAMGFLAAALLGAIVVLPVRGMRLDRVLGVGLLVVYLCFLCVRLGSLKALGGSSIKSYCTDRVDC